MNAKEAADVLLKEFDKSAGNYLYQNAHKIDFEEALFLGAKALKKQIPKKPVKDKYHHNCCSSCGWIVSYDEGWGEKYVPYCENCGQAIDWSDKK